MGLFDFAKGIGRKLFDNESDAEEKIREHSPWGGGLGDLGDIVGGLRRGGFGRGGRGGGFGGGGFGGGGGGGGGVRTGGGF